MPGRAARQRRHQVQWIRQQDHGRLQERHRQVHRLGKGARLHLNQLTNMH
ncbi:Pectin lyase-like superfamily protein, partial [Zea mays]